MRCTEKESAHGNAIIPQVDTPQNEVLVCEICSWRQIYHLEDIMYGNIVVIQVTSTLTDLRTAGL